MNNAKVRLISLILAIFGYENARHLPLSDETS